MEHNLSLYSGRIPVTDDSFGVYHLSIATGTSCIHLNFQYQSIFITQVFKEFEQWTLMLGTHFLSLLYEVSHVSSN